MPKPAFHVLFIKNGRHNYRTHAGGADILSWSSRDKECNKTKQLCVKKYFIPH